MGLVMFCLLVMVVTVVATVGEGHRGETQRQGHREQQHYGQLSGQLLTSFLFVLFRSKRKLGIPPWEPYSGLHTLLLFASPLRLACVLLPTSMMLRAQPYAIGLSDYFTLGNSGQGNCPSPREFGHLLVSTAGGTIADGARITRVELGGELLPRTLARRTSENLPSTHSGEWRIEHTTAIMPLVERTRTCC